MHVVATLKARWKTVRTYLAIFGLRGWVHVAYCAFNKRKKQVAVHRRWSRHPLYIRLNSSDVSVFRQVFMDREYEIADSVALRNGWLIDGGANIGLTSVYFADRHPEARICAVEPDAANFDMLRANTAAYPNVRLVRGALWDHDGAVRIARPDDKEWAFRVEEAAPVEADIPAMRVSTLLRDIGADRVALLKLDIEGAEQVVLQDAAGWIDGVDNIVIELHETLRPGCSALFAEATKGFDVIAEGRELTLASRRP